MNNSSMSKFEALPQEIVIEIGEMCAWPASSEEPPPSKHLAALIRTSRWLYNLFNATLYRKNLKQDAPVDSCVLWAAEHGCLDTIKMAVSFGTEVNVSAADDDGFTPLHKAAAKGDSDILRLLLAQPGIIVAGKSIYGDTPLSLAIARGHLHCARLLLERPKYNLKNLEKNGRTMLHILCEKTEDESDSTLDFICSLIDRGCPLEAELDDRLIALDIAIGRQRRKIARLLRSYTIISGSGHGSSQTCRICHPIDQLRSDRTLGSGHKKRDCKDISIELSHSVIL
ncbi:hypothetical protein V2G26_009651 [Clonostachys chloroleuca]